MKPPAAAFAPVVGGAPPDRPEPPPALAPLAVFGDLMAPPHVQVAPADLAAAHRALAAIPSAHRLAVDHRRGAKLVVRAATDAVAEAACAAQSAAAEGPTLDALDNHQVSVSADLHTDPRWPTLARSLPDGVRCAVSVPLAAAGHPDVTLTAYGENAGVFGDDIVDQAVEAAAELAIVLAAAHWRSNAGNLAIALATSRRIGAAIGILMCQLHVTEDQAFTALRLTSQRLHRKLRDIADDVLLTGALPDAAAPGSTASR